MIRRMNLSKVGRILKKWRHVTRTKLIELKFHQTSGSCSYIVHCENLGDKYKDEDPNALDLFKECYYSNKKKGYTPSVHTAIDQIEIQISETTKVEQPKSISEVVADVLAENTKNSKFLQNVGIQTVRPTSSVQNLEAELVVEKRTNANLRLVVNTQREQIYVL